MNTSNVVCLTGATGKIGRQLVRRFATLGWTVVAVSRSAQNLAALTSEFNDLPGRLEAAVSDLMAEASATELARDLQRRGLLPQCLINNARDITNLAPQSDGRPSAAQWSNEFRLGVTVAHDLTVTLGALPSTPLESVINISSIYGIVASNPHLYTSAGQSFIHYNVTKAALIHLSRELAVRLAPRIRVNTISYGGVEGRVDADFRQRYAQLCPAGRMLREDEVAGAAEFLASPAASAITGHNLVVDGGWTAW